LRGGERGIVGGAGGPARSDAVSRRKGLCAGMTGASASGRCAAWAFGLICPIRKTIHRAWAGRTDPLRDTAVLAAQRAEPVRRYGHRDVSHWGMCEMLMGSPVAAGNRPRHPTTGTALETIP
jgi:hypothetical protein